MKLLVILLAVLATLVAGNGSPPAPPPRPPPPPRAGGKMASDEMSKGKSPCCFPAQWSGKRGDYTAYKDRYGNKGEKYTLTAFDIDFPGHKYRGNEVTYNMEHEVVKNVSFYGDLNRRRIDVIKEDECIWQDLPKTTFGQCISKEATFAGSDIIGIGESSFSVDTYMATYAYGGTHMYMKIGVTSEGCVPVFSTIGGKLSGGEEMMIDTKFYNNKDVIADLAILDAPAQCKDSAQVETDDYIKGKIFLQDVFFPQTSPGKCCFLKSWEGKVTQMISITINGETTNLANKMSHVAVDFDKLKVAASMHVYSNGVSYKNMTVIADLRFGVMYTKDVDTQECKKYNVPTTEKMKWECVPPNAVHVGSPTIGLKKHGLDTSMWSVKQQFPEENSKSDIKIVVAQMNGSCVPVSKTAVETTPNSNKMMSTAFYDMWEGIRDDDVFRPPDACTGATNEPLDRMPKLEYDAVNGFILF